MRLVNKNEADNSIYAQIYLQDIHVFAMSNLLKRPIIVLGVPVVREVAPSFIRGIYLPLLNDPTECVKEPIIIAFHEFHFCPLIYVMNNTDEKNSLGSNGILGDVFKDDMIFQIENENSILGKKRTHNYIPLVYSNLESMTIHFLKPDEEKKAHTLLETYFKTGFIKVKDGTETEEPIHVLAAKCFTNLTFNNNSIDKYCDYVNDSILPKKRKK